MSQEREKKDNTLYPQITAGKEKLQGRTYGSIGFKLCLGQRTEVLFTKIQRDKFHPWRQSSEKELVGFEVKILENETHTIPTTL